MSHLESECPGRCHILIAYTHPLPRTVLPVLLHTRMNFSTYKTTSGVSHAIRGCMYHRD
jgi:hypothetical protein